MAINVTFQIELLSLKSMKLCFYLSLVTETLEIKDPNLDLKAALKLDYYVSALWWCKQQSYSADQTSAFFTVIDTLLKNVGKFVVRCIFLLICYQLA